MTSNFQSTMSTTCLQVIDFGKAIDLRLETGEEGEEEQKMVGDQQQEEKKETEVTGGKTEQKGRTGKYHLDYFGIAGKLFSSFCFSGLDNFCCCR
jgi:hypothetical protein